MAAKRSTQYVNTYVNKYLSEARDVGGHIYVITFTHTVGGGPDGSEAQNDTVALADIPLNMQVTDIDVAWDALGASTTMSIGDAGSATRYLSATAVTSAGRASGPSGTAGQNFKVATAANQQVVLTWGGATPTASAVVKGVIRGIQAS